MFGKCQKEERIFTTARMADERAELYINGTRKYRSVYGKTYRETKGKLGKLRSENAVLVRKSGLTVEEVMFGWLSSVKVRAKESSIAGYRTKLNVHILPFFEPRCFTNRFKRLLKKAGVPSIRFHALRHSFATSCLQCGFDIKTLSEILGHAGADTTMRIYVHSSMERKRECMAMLTYQI